MLRSLKTYLRFSANKKKIKFEFKAPVEQEFVKEKVADTNNKTVKFTKLNRKNPQELGLKPSQPEYQGQFEHLTKTEAAYEQNIKKKIEDNLATKRFYQYELARGEDLIDNIPVNPYYEYKLADLKLQIEARRKQIDQFTNVQQFVDPNRLQKLKNVVSGYQTMKHRYELEEFTKKLQDYPGSIKGPHPEDDPATYSEYVQSIIPDWVKAELLLKNRTDSNVKIQQKTNQAIAMGAKSISDYLSNDRKISQIKQNDEDQFFQQVLEGLDSPTNIVSHSEVPLLPQVKFEEYHSYMQKIRTWNKFRYYYDKANQKSRNEKFVKVLNNMAQGRMQAQTIKDKQNEQEQQIQQSATPSQQVAKDEVTLDKHQLKKLKKQMKKKKRLAERKKLEVKMQPKIHSIYTYYKTLPKQIQESPIVRTVYLGLEYCQPDLTYEQKQQTLNKAAKLTLPLDKFSQAVMTKLLSQKRAMLTPHLNDRVLNMPCEFTWDIHQFLNQVKEEKLRSMSTVKQKQQSYPEPPELHKVWEEGMANLPVDFYDNDDGFWTDYLDKKLQRYQKVQPLSKTSRKHFIH